MVYFIHIVGDLAPANDKVVTYSGVQKLSFLNELWLQKATSERELGKSAPLIQQLQNLMYIINIQGIQKHCHVVPCVHWEQHKLNLIVLLDKDELMLVSADPFLPLLKVYILKYLHTKIRYTPILCHFLIRSVSSSRRHCCKQGLCYTIQTKYKFPSRQKG